jgi:hypothetical protein
MQNDDREINKNSARKIISNASSRSYQLSDFKHMQRPSMLLLTSNDPKKRQTSLKAPGSRSINLCTSIRSYDDSRS